MELGEHALDAVEILRESLGVVVRKCHDVDIVPGRERQRRMLVVVEQDKVPLGAGSCRHGAGSEFGVARERGRGISHKVS